MTSSRNFNFEGVNAILGKLVGQCHAFIAGPGGGVAASRIELSAEVRYPSEIWELEVPLRTGAFTSIVEVEQLRQDFHTIHREIFGTDDPGSPVDFIAWRAHVSCRLRSGEIGRPRPVVGEPAHDGRRRAYFPRVGLVDSIVRHFDALAVGDRLEGPAIIESPVTTVVIDPGALAERLPSGSLSIKP
jgi:N-methylhydantoinase A